MLPKYEEIKRWDLVLADSKPNRDMEKMTTKQIVQWSFLSPVKLMSKVLISTNKIVDFLT